MNRQQKGFFSDLGHGFIWSGHSMQVVNEDGTTTPYKAPGQGTVGYAIGSGAAQSGQYIRDREEQLLDTGEDVLDFLNPDNLMVFGAIVVAVLLLR